MDNNNYYRTLSGILLLIIIVVVANDRIRSSRQDDVLYQAGTSVMEEQSASAKLGMAQWKLMTTVTELSGSSADPSADVDEGSAPKKNGGIDRIKRPQQLNVGKLTQTEDGTELVINTVFNKMGPKREVVVFPKYIIDPQTNKTRVGAGNAYPIIHTSGIEALAEENKQLRKSRDAALLAEVAKDAAMGGDARKPEKLSNEDMGPKYTFVNEPTKRDIQDEIPGKAAKKLTPRSMSEYRNPYSSCERNAYRLVNITKSFLSDDPRAARQYSKLTGWPDSRHESPIEHERCQAVIVRMLFIFSSLMDELGLQGSWFLSHGSLLGAVRHGGMIPWDVDIDIAITKKGFNRLEKLWSLGFPREMFLQTYHTDPEYRLQIGNKASGFYEQTRVSDRYSSYKDYKFPAKGKNLRYYHAGPQLDLIPIYTHKQTGKRMILNTPAEADTLFPTKLMCFEGVLLPVPNQWKLFLDTMYGKDAWSGFPEEKFIHLNFYHASKCRASTPSKFSKWWLDMKRDNAKMKEWREAVEKDEKGSRGGGGGGSAEDVASKAVEGGSPTKNRKKMSGGPAVQAIREKGNDIHARNDPVHCRYDRKKVKMMCGQNLEWRAPTQHQANRFKNTKADMWDGAVDTAPEPKDDGGAAMESGTEKNPVEQVADPVPIGGEPAQDLPVVTPQPEAPPVAEEQGAEPVVPPTRKQQHQRSTPADGGGEFEDVVKEQKAPVYKASDDAPE